MIPNLSVCCVLSEWLIVVCDNIEKKNNFFRNTINKLKTDRHPEPRHAFLRRRRASRDGDDEDDY